MYHVKNQEMGSSIMKNIKTKFNKFSSKFYENLPYTIAIHMFFIAFWATLCVFSKDEIVLVDLWLNLLASFIASLCTLLLIERTLQNRKEKNELPLRIARYRDIQLFTSRLITLWMRMFQFTSQWEKEISIDTLFTKDIINGIYERLNMQEEAPVLPKQNWNIYINNYITDLIDRGNHILDRYVSIMPPELFGAIHHLTNDSPFIERLRNINELERTGISMRVPLLKHYIPLPSSRDYESIHILFQWCESEYEKLEQYPDIYPIQLTYSVIPAKNNSQAAPTK